MLPKTVDSDAIIERIGEKNFSECVPVCMSSGRELSSQLVFAVA